jgi:hypothetical protein
MAFWGFAVLSAGAAIFGFFFVKNPEPAPVIDPHPYGEIENKK